MKDLELHARLHEGALDEGLIRALQGLAWRPVERRVAYLGLLEACLRHESAALRAAAVACLSGCLGPRAIRAMVAGLDDPSEPVWHAAIDALADTARTHSSRYAHALFHGDAAIRRRALERCPPEAHELAARLFADPACADRVQSIDLPNDVGFVLGLVERGHLSVVEGRAWLLARDPNALMRFLLTHLGPGTVHRLLALFDDGPADERERIHRRLAGLAGRNESLGELLAGAMRAEAIRDPEGPALELALRLDLAVLLEEAIGGDHRRAALAALGGTRPLFPKDPSERRELAEALFDRLLRPAGALHWAGATALAALVDGGQLAFLLGQLHPEAGGDGSSRRARMRLLVERAIADPEPFHRLMRADQAALRRFGAATKELTGPADPRAPLASVLLASCAHREELVDDLRAIWSPTDLVHAIHALEPRFERVLTSDVMKRAYAVGLRKHLGAGVSWPAILGGLDPEGPLGGRVLESLATLGTESLVEALRALAVDVLVRWLPLIERLPSGRDHAVAAALAAHADPRVASWAKERELFAVQPPPRDVPSLHELTDEEVAAIAEGGPVPVDRPLRRLCEALEERVLFPTPSICGALLACGDPFEEVAAALHRWSDEGAIFGPHFDGRVVDDWFGQAGSLLLHAWLYRWEAHAEQAARRALELGPAFLAKVARWPCAELSDRVFRAIGRELRVARYRGPDARLEPWATAPWIDGFIAQLDTPHGVGAARALTAIYERGLATDLLATRREAVAARLATFTDAVREDLRGWISSRGLPSRTRASRIVAGRQERLREVRRSRDLDRLAEWLSDWAVGEDAAIRLVELGEKGERRLLAVIDEGGERSVVAARATLLFEHLGPSELRARLANGSLPPEARFLIATALDDAEVAVTIACEPLAGESWLRVEDAERLERQLGERFMRLAASSPHPAAYELAVQRALAGDDLDALRAFLFADDQRDGRLRFRCALKLHVAGDRCGAPILWEHALLGDGYVHDFDAKTFAPVGAGVLLLGVGRLEQRFFDRVDRSTTTPVAAELWSAALRDGTTRHTRTRAASALAHIARRRDRAIRELAEVFAWGTKRGLELTGRLMRFHLVSDPRHFGHTDLRSHDVHVTARPILKGEPEGQRVVEGLVLHELGHQLYHRGREHLAVWERAGRKRMQPLMNLVLDEHLERNLRALDAEFGDRLKTLCAYAFQHGGRSMVVVELVGALGVDAAPALIATELSVAEEPDSVRVGSGPLLGALERQGHSFARFFRALRMGLGDRHDDPKVRAGLALFDRRFRHAGPEELWAVALELQRIFGEEIGLAAHIGGHETEAAGELEGVTEGAGVHESEVQREVERILEPPKKSQRGSKGGGTGRLAINVGADAGFEPITEVVRLPQDREAHRAVMREVALPSRRLRRAFEELGVRAVPQRRRLSGHRLDRTQLKALITRRDPRILVARERVLARDLFLGMAIDCSGSMVGESMDKAHRFGVLLAEATRGLDGVDTRIFGFTDSRIFDCGDADSCAVTSLEPGGGNNDAAGLAHVAAHARQSRRSSKLLVMISDGLPTECSVDAVRTLSRKLAREGLMNAQIAVRPLEEQCFDHYIEVLDQDYATAAARFGKVLMKLASRALS